VTEAVGFVLTSDVHLTSDSDELFHLWTDTVQRALQKIRSPSKKLLILGDLWEVYIADHPGFQRAHPKFDQFFHELRSQGVDIEWFEGNHDLYFPEANHVEVSGSTRFFVCHGDQLNTKDVSYLRLKKVLHHPAVKFLATQLPGRVVSGIGERLKKQSREHWVKEKPWGWSEYVRAIEERAPNLRGQGVSLFVFGHCHWKCDDLISGLRVVNLGFFPKDRAVFVIDGQRQEWVAS
jgi:UDP-2,3-diacylglucosamine hydrolase